MTKCLLGCTCGHHSAKQSKCVEGCTCKRHTNSGAPKGECRPGCRCSRHPCPEGCTRHKHIPPPYEERVAKFWGRFRREGACLIWTGSGAKENGKRYGEIQWEGKSPGTPTGTHVVAFILSYGPVPDGKEVCHTRDCTSKLCGEPTHLYAGTRKENMEDCTAMGRQGNHANKTMNTERSMKMLEARRLKFDEKRKQGIPLRRTKS